MAATSPAVHTTHGVHHGHKTDQHGGDSHGEHSEIAVHAVSICHTSILYLCYQLKCICMCLLRSLTDDACSFLRGIMNSILTCLKLTF